MIEMMNERRGPEASIAEKIGDFLAVFEQQGIPLSTGEHDTDVEVLRRQLNTILIPLATHDPHEAKSLNEKVDTLTAWLKGKGVETSNLQPLNQLRAQVALFSTTIASLNNYFGR